MTAQAKIKARKYKAYTRKDIDKIPELQTLEHHDIVATKAVSAVLPFRVNRYVIEELIQWEDVPNDPIYQLTFPQRGMLDRKDLSRMVELVWRNASPKRLNLRLERSRPDSIPTRRTDGVQRTPYGGGTPCRHAAQVSGNGSLLPEPSQTCHAYCTYCFRWPQFVGIDELKFASKEGEKLVTYLRQHPEVNSVLFTGGDPLIMKTAVLRRYLEPLLAPNSNTSSASGWEPRRPPTGPTAFSPTGTPMTCFVSSRSAAMRGNI